MATPNNNPYPKHYYRAGHPALVVQNASDEANAVSRGFAPHYVHQEYPKWVDVNGHRVLVEFPEADPTVKQEQK
jgi:hypothetical protein